MMSIERRDLVAGAVASLVLASSARAQQKTPRYEGTPVTRWLKNTNKMELVEPFAFYDAKGWRWSVPKGWKIDGASIPRVLWTVAGSPFDGNYRDASVIHDYYCDTKERTWRDTHRVFYDAMLVSGVSRIEAGQKYWAVYHFGPRWRDPGRGWWSTDPDPAPARSISDLEAQLAVYARARKAIELGDLGPADIEAELNPLSMPLGR